MTSSTVSIYRFASIAYHVATLHVYYSYIAPWSVTTQLTMITSCLTRLGFNHAVLVVNITAKTKGLKQPRLGYFSCSQKYY